MKQFLYKITPTRLGMVEVGPTDQESAIVGEHFRYLTSLTEKGTALVFGRTQNSDANTFGIAIFRAESEGEARLIMENDPAVKQGVMRPELYPYKIAGLNTRDWKAD
jgi:uncharacterized protein YciI